MMPQSGLSFLFSLHHRPDQHLTLHKNTAPSLANRNSRCVNSPCIFRPTHYMTASSLQTKRIPLWCRTWFALLQSWLEDVETIYFKLVGWCFTTYLSGNAKVCSPGTHKILGEHHSGIILKGFATLQPLDPGLLVKSVHSFCHIEDDDWCSCFVCL